ncbi:MAG: winged helix-turn-helix domain-containing protein [Thermoplasmata archaeon]
MPTPAHGWKPDLYVVARLLEKLWREDDPMLKTRLQVAANLNYDVFTRYLSWMEEKGLVELVDSPDGHERVNLTRRGEDGYLRLVQWIQDIFSIWDRSRGSALIIFSQPLSSLQSDDDCQGLHQLNDVGAGGGESRRGAGHCLAGPFPESIRLWVRGWIESPLVRYP